MHGRYTVDDDNIQDLASMLDLEFGFYELLDFDAVRRRMQAVVDAPPTTTKAELLALLQ
jgi:hypothetical protein